ncbi:MAG: hypothetical protein ACYC6M_07505 [Terriglobales bacterium]
MPASFSQTIGSAVVAAAVLAGCFLQFALYYLKGRRSRNRSYLLSAAGLFCIFLAMAGTTSLAPLFWILTWPLVRDAAFWLGAMLLFASLAYFVYITYLRPNRLQFEDAMVEALPQPPDEGPTSGSSL